MADIRLVAASPVVAAPPKKRALTLCTDTRTTIESIIDDEHSRLWRDAWYALGKAPCERVRPEMVIDAISEFQQRLKELELMEEEHEDCIDPGEHEDLAEELKGLEQEYEELFNAHDELKELCWSSLEMEADDLASLKSFLHDEDKHETHRTPGDK